MLCFFRLLSILGLILHTNNIVGMYKNSIRLLDVSYQIIVWSYWHRHLHCLCALATYRFDQCQAQITCRRLIEEHILARVLNASPSEKNKRSWWFLHSVHWIRWPCKFSPPRMDGVPLIELINNVKLFFFWFLLHHMSVVLIVYATHLCNSYFNTKCLFERRGSS
jgi:hypothetical protein